MALSFPLLILDNWEVGENIVVVEDDVADAAKPLPVIIIESGEIPRAAIDIDVTSG